MSNRRPKRATQVFDRGHSSKSSKPPLRYNDIVHDRYSEMDDTISIRSSRSQQNIDRKTIQQFQSENLDLQRRYQTLTNEHQKLNTEILKLKTENQELKNALTKRDEHIQQLMEQVKEMQNSKFSKHLKFSSLKQNFQSMFHRRKTKEELMSKNILQNEPYFRTTLDKMEKDAIYRDVPRVLVEAVKVLDEKFMHVIGLYRVSGNYAVVQDMRFQVNNNNFDALRVQKDPHTITGIIKLLFRELEEPLISLKHLNAHVDDSNFLSLGRGDQVRTVQNMVGTLPPVSRETLRYLMHHLTKVIQNPVNQTSAHSLSVVVGACIFYELLSDVDFQTNLAKCTVSNKCIEIMIEDYSAVFEQV